MSFFYNFLFRLPSALKGLSLNPMSEPSSPTPTPKWVIVVFLVAFIGSAAWGGYVLAKNAHLRQRGQPSDPIQNQTLFGR